MKIGTGLALAVACSALVALRQVLARDHAQETQVVVEVDQAAQVVRVVQRRAGRVELDETLNRRQRCCHLTAAPVGVGQVQQGLLRQQGTCGQALDTLEVAATA